MKAYIGSFPKHMLDLILPFEKKKLLISLTWGIFFSLWVARCFSLGGASHSQVPPVLHTRGRDQTASWRCPPSWRPTSPWTPRANLSVTTSSRRGPGRCPRRSGRSTTSCPCPNTRPLEPRAYQYNRYNRCDKTIGRLISFLGLVSLPNKLWFYNNDCFLCFWSSRRSGGEDVL